MQSGRKPAVRIIREGAELDECSRDSGLLTLKPRAVYVASTAAEVVQALADASQSGLVLTARGSGTGIPTMSVGTGIVLTQDPGGIEPSPGRVRVSPGVVKQTLDEALDRSGSWMPVSPSSYRSCSVGGMVSTNASGARTLLYRSTIDYVESLSVVLPEEGEKEVTRVPLEEALSDYGSTGRVARLLVENGGRIAREAPKVTKNSCGYRLERAIHDGFLDLPKLFCGSEGTLGVITRVVFRTVAKPARRAMLVFECAFDDLDRLVAALRARSPSAIELVDKSIFAQTGREKDIAFLSRTELPYLIFFELDGSGERVSQKVLDLAADPGLAGLDPLVIMDEGRLEDAWRVRSDALVVAGEIKKGDKVAVPGVEDVVVPPDMLGSLVKLLSEVFESKGLEFISYGHAGDANLHMRPLLDPTSRAGRRLLDDVMEDSFKGVWKMGGSITGEHGDGRLRAPYVKRQYRETYELMREIKQIYDPRGLLNRGVKIAEETG
jgi:glycolate dehydrogenase FAD-linked subunit